MLVFLLITAISTELCASDSVQIQYRATALCYPDSSLSVAEDISDKGEIVGFAYSTLKPEVNAFLYDGARFIELGHLGYPQAAATGINESGVVVGRAYQAKPNERVTEHAVKGCEHGFVYTQAGMRDIGTLGGCNSYSMDVNNEGVIVGWSEKPPESGIGVSSFVYVNGAMTELRSIGRDSAAAQALNNRGEIVGNYTNASGDSRAFLFDGTKSLDLGSLGGSFVYVTDLNDNGSAVGRAQTTSQNVHAFLFEHGEITDLHVVGQSKAIGSMANAINNSGIIVGVLNTSRGQQGFIYRNGKMTVVNELLDENSKGWNIEDIRGINSQGQAVGFGSFRGKKCAVRLTPFE